MKLLDRKLLRDLAALRGQVVTIALVVAAGVAVFVSSVSTFSALRSACENFYAESRFPQIFVTLKRAPLSIVARLSEVPGVTAVEPRIVRDVLLDWPASNLPVSARIVSISRAGDETLARLYLRNGIAPAARDPNNAAISEAFAEANDVKPGTEIRVLVNQKMQSFHVTGIALSSEYVYAVKPGLPIPDDRFYAIMWVDRSAAEAAFDMKGAFNDAIVSLAPAVDPRPVIAELDRLLEPYGSVGAIDQRDQISNRFLQDELNQQKLMAITIPFIFFGISAFLLNVVLGRMVAAQREQIATLKALGFPTAQLVLHYMKLVAIIVLTGSALGAAVGCGFSSAMVKSYHGFFHLPVLAFELAPWSIFASTSLSLAAASFGVLSTLRKLVVMAPAIAMHPETPLRFHRSRLERSLPRGFLTSRRVMVFRNIAGRPLRTGLTIVGIGFALPMVVLGLFWRDAIDQMIEIQFGLVERGNVGVTFPHPLDRRIVADLARQPGVLVVEGQRVVPVRVRAGHRTYLTSITGLPGGSELRRPHDTDLRRIDVRSDGVTFTRRLADRLSVKLGDTISIEVMEGRRLKRDLPVTAIADESIGMAAYMDLDSLNALTREGAVVSGATMYVERSFLPVLSRRLKDLPVIESVATKADTLTSFLSKIAGLVFMTAGIITVFAIIIAAGVVYNAARISLQERAWELASLRVLGFTRSEVARTLFGEFTVEIATGIPLGVLASYFMVDSIARSHSNESFQIPGVIEPRTYLAAIAVVLTAAVASAFAVRRRIDGLDLVSVLKTRD